MMSPCACPPHWPHAFGRADRRQGQQPLSDVGDPTVDVMRHEEWRDRFIEKWSTPEIACTMALDRMEPFPTREDTDMAVSALET